MTAGVLLIDAAARVAIDALVARARQHPVPLEVVMAGAVAPDKPNVSLADRKPGFERPPSDTLVLGTYRVSFSFEHQPAGLCGHLSASSPDSSKVPGPEVMEMLATEFGFRGSWPGDCHVWLEEFAPGHRAVNLVWLAEEGEDGPVREVRG